MEGFSKTQAVVLELLAQDGIAKNRNHIVWLDNLFTSVRLLVALKSEGFGAAGTVRTKKTAREVLEEKEGTQALDRPNHLSTYLLGPMMRHENTKHG